MQRSTPRPQTGSRRLRALVAAALVATGLLFALWPVRADATRFELEAAAGGQPLSQLESRLADPQQRQRLQARPRCGLPVAAPLTYTQDTALRSGCAGPNGRSTSLAFLTLLLATGLFYSVGRDMGPHAMR